MNQKELTEKDVENLLEKAQLSTEQLVITNNLAGGNNRIYKVETKSGIYALKKYFRGVNDKRDRLAAEFDFLNYAIQVVPDFVPKSYAQDTIAGLALYEYLDGNSIGRASITEQVVSQAISFFCQLNDSHHRSLGKDLPVASEAVFSIQGHLDLIGARVKELNDTILGDADYIAARPVIFSLNHLWDVSVKDVIDFAEANNIDLNKELDDSLRCISPSDFGFHNALMTKNQQIRFIDFEYAGWDDPARMVNDFFSQLAVPVPLKYYDWFVQEVMRPFSNPDMLVLRAKLLRRIYQIKWCCIALNVFIPRHRERRQYANPHLDLSALYKAQIAKAELILTNMEVAHHE